MDGTEIDDGAGTGVGGTPRKKKKNIQGIDAGFIIKDAEGTLVDTVLITPDLYSPVHA